MMQTINRSFEPCQKIPPMKDLSKSFNSHGSYRPMILSYKNLILSSREDKNPINVSLDSSNRKKKIAQHTGKEYFELKLSDKILQLPFTFKDLKAEIDASRYILELEEGWDGENGESYNIHVWERVIEFLVSMYLRSVRMFDVIPDFPKIYHGPDGTIDLLWEKADYQILANCPKEKNKQVTFYGENVKKESFKGSFQMMDNCLSLLMILVGIKKCGM